MGHPACRTPADNRKLSADNPADATLQSPTAFIGCDVGKSTIVILDSRTRRTIAVNNKPSDIAVFARRLDATCLVVCEATGGHELALLATMLEASIPCRRADGRRVKGFIRSLGSMAKTYKIDAAGLAAYGRDRHAILTLWQAQDTARDRLRTRLVPGPAGF